jgi:hypothetical protein
MELPHLKKLAVKTAMFPYCSIHKYTWITSDGKSHSQIDHILIDGQRHLSVLDVQSFRAADCDTGHCLLVEKVRDRLAAHKQRSHRFHVELVQTQEVR